MLNLTAVLCCPPQIPKAFTDETNINQRKSEQPPLPFGGITAELTCRRVKRRILANQPPSEPLQLPNRAEIRRSGAVICWAALLHTEGFDPWSQPALSDCGLTSSQCLPPYFSLKSNSLLWCIKMWLRTNSRSTSPGSASTARNSKTVLTSENSS